MVRTGDYNNGFMDPLQQNLKSNSSEGAQAASKIAFFARNRGWKWWLGVVLFYLGVAILTRLLEDLFQMTGLMPANDHTDPSIPAMAIVAVTTLAWSTLTSSVSLTILVGSSRATDRSMFRTVELLLIETIRGLGAVLLRLPLLILPAVYEWIRLTPIPYIVLWDRAYQAGDVDALQASREFFRSHKTRVLSLLVLSLMIFLIEFATTSSSQDTAALWVNPVESLLPILIFAPIHLACDIFTLEMYRRVLKNGTR